MEARCPLGISAPVGLWKSGISRAARGAVCRTAAATASSSQPEGRGSETGRAPVWRSVAIAFGYVGLSISTRSPVPSSATGKGDGGEGARGDHHLVGGGRQAALAVAGGDGLAQVRQAERVVARAAGVAGQLLHGVPVGRGQPGGGRHRRTGEVDAAGGVQVRVQPGGDLAALTVRQGPAARATPGREVAAFSTAYARVTVVRLTSRAPVSSRSLGRRVPGGMRPSAMSRRRLSARPR